MKDILDGSGWTVTRVFNDSDPAYVTVIDKI
jgi:hypothetical protein